MSYITKDQLNLYLQNVSNQSNGTTKSRSTLNGPRPPTFGAKASSRKIFQDGPPSAALSSPITPTSARLDSAIKSLALSSVPRTPPPEPSSPILESMGESGPSEAEPVVMESMGSDGHEPVHPVYPQPYATMHGQPGTLGPLQTWSAHGYTMGPHHQPHPGGFGNPTIPPQFYNTPHNHNQQPQQQQQHSIHLSQEQYLNLQQQQFQQQEYLRQQHAAHAAAHGYHPVPGSSGHLPNSMTPQMQASVPTTTSTPSKTITPRIVPIVEIPKYTTINPPKTEIVDDNVDSDNDWAPDPPPRDGPKKIDTKVTAKLLASTGPPTPPKVDIQQQKPVSVASSFKSSPTSASHPTTPVSTENAMPAEDDRVPLPPPREFRRQSVGLQTLTGAGAGAVEAAATTSPGSSATSLTRPGSSSIFRVTQTSSPSSTQTTTAGSSFKNTSVPAPGTVRTNSAKFNALAASASGKDALLPSPKSISPKSANSVLSSTNIAVSTTSSPWTARKTVENTRRNSLSKGSALAATLGSAPAKERKSLDGSSATTSSPRQESAVIPPETYADKELPPIRPDTPPSSQPANITAVAAEMTATPLRGHYFNAQPVSDEGKCIVTEEDKLAGVPVADDASKEAVIVEEGDEKKDVSPSPSGIKKPPSPAKGARRKSSGAGADKQASSAFICSSCEEPISGMMITAMGKRWHSDHFVCTVCDLNLEHVQFFQKDGLPYCHFDYHDKFSPKCGHCDSAIENECLTALGKNWHPGHFFCRECGDPFGEDGYMVHDDFPYCEKDYLRLFAPKCTGCLDPIQGDFISALKGKWHRDCFGCTVCHIGFDTASYYVENGKPYCQTHYKTGAQPVVA